MFWDIYTHLCAIRGESPNKVAKNLSIASGTVTEWKKGRTPQNATLKKLADYFGVSVDYLLGKTEQKEKPVGVPDELWEKLSADPQKMQLAIWLASLSDADFARVQKLMEAALLLPPE